MTGPIGSDRLVRISENLTRADRAVLKRLEQHRYLTTEQVARFDFADRPSKVAAVRAAHRSLKKLRLDGLMVMLERTVGGAARGSSAAIWTLTNAGLRVSNLASPDAEYTRRRIAEPTLIFLKHEVAVAELHLALLEAAPRASATITELQLEPNCWRRYLAPLGALATLKPDLAAHVETDEFESAYFFEVDRATEPPHRIIAKSLQYQEYYRSGEEERRSGVLPLVVWVVPTEARRGQLQRHLTETNGMNVRLYRVIVFEEIEPLIADDDAVGLLPRTEQLV